MRQPRRAPPNPAAAGAGRRVRGAAKPAAARSAAADLGGLDAHVGYMLRRAQLAVFADFIGGMRGPVARPGQFSVLAVIGRNPGMSQAQLCDALRIKRANLVSVIDQLESRGLARREASPADRRSNRLQLTPAGRRALQGALADLAAHEARLSRLLGAAGRRALLAQLAKLTELQPS